VISNSNSLSIESNLNINNTYDLINDNFSITDFGENDAFNFEEIPSSNESRNK
jgi:hypothetical protein